MTTALTSSTPQTMIPVSTAPHSMNLYKKIAAIMGTLDAIPKTGHNKTQGYFFIEQAVVVAILRPLMAEYGLVILPAMDECCQETRTNANGTLITHTLAHTAYTLINADSPAEAITLSWWAECDGALLHAQ